MLRCALFRSFPFWPLLMSLLSDCGRSVSLPRLWVGEPLAPFRRNGEQGGGAFPRNTAALEVTRPGDSERKKRHLQSLTSYIRQYHPEPKTLLCSGQPSFADDRKSSCAECIVAALFMIQGFISVVKLILPARYPKGTKLHWVVQGRMLRMPSAPEIPLPSSRSGGDKVHFQILSTPGARCR